LKRAVEIELIVTFSINSENRVKHETDLAVSTTTQRFCDLLVTYKNWGKKRGIITSDSVGTLAVALRWSHPPCSFQPSLDS